MHDLHELDLVELVLPYHAARVFAVGTRLAAKTWRMAYELQRQVRARNNRVAHYVGDRHFGGRNKIELLAITAWHNEQVRFEFRQLPCTAHGIRINNVRNI